MTQKPKISAFMCHRCSQLIAERQGDVLIHHSLRIPLSRSLVIPCPVCAVGVLFKVERHKPQRLALKT
jgi:DNA-directed RNA polymerase subunit RPC12/RpoP